MELIGKTVLITGGARRIGRACALKLAREGADVIIHYNKSEEEAEELAGSIRMHGRKAWSLQKNLSLENSAEELIAEILGKTGGVDILVNSASIFPEGTWLNTEALDFMENYKINALSPFLLSREFAAQKKRGDCIINFLDARVGENDNNHLAYHMSKRALLSFTRLLSSELAPRIRVNAIAPGLILPPPGENEEYLKTRSHTNPLNRVGTLEEITDSLSFLIHNTFITGQVLFVDGGRHLKGSFYGL